MNFINQCRKLKRDELRIFLRLHLISKITIIQAILRILSLLAAMLVIPAYILYFGFYLTDFTFQLILFFIDFSFWLFVIKYLLKHLLHKSVYIFQNYRTDTFAAAFIIVNYILTITNIAELLPVFGDSEHTFFSVYQIITITILFTIIYSSEFSKALTFISTFPINPAQIMAMVFIFVIISGAFMLKLPKMHNGDLSFIDALFTSGSAACVTGLSVIDVDTKLTFKGQLVLMGLMQIGGLNIISFAMFLTYFYTRSVGLGMNNILKDIFNLKQYSDIRRVVKQIIIVSFAIEIVGTILMFFAWDPNIDFNGAGNKLYYSAFHSVSAFNNAGFSLFKNSLTENIVATNYSVHYIIAILIILGGLGFTVLPEVLSVRSLPISPMLRISRFSVNTKIVLSTTFALLLFGTVGFYLLEYNNILKGFSWDEKLHLSFFQSVTTRTAGYNSVDMSKLLMPTYWIFIMLMFIGASPGSTGGGIKTTTFLMLFKSGLSILKKQKNINIFKKSIPFSHIDYAYALSLLAVIYIFISTFILTITEQGVRFEALLFEEVSAFATVGLSMGITANLSFWGKIVIIVSMFIGRIGPLTLTLSFMNQQNKEKVYYTKSDVLIG